jgi:DNA invertase Pin-like site-specific DNA recombinase
MGLTNHVIRMEFKKASLTSTGEDSPTATLLLSILCAVGEFERPLIKERQRAGIAIAKHKGLYRGRKCSLSEEPS